MEELKEKLDLNDPGVGLALIYLLFYAKNSMTITKFSAKELYNKWEKVFYDPKYQEWSTSAPYIEKIDQETLEKTYKKVYGML